MEAPDQGLAHTSHADHTVAEALQLVQDHTRSIVHVVLRAAPRKDGNKVSWGRKRWEFADGSEPALLLTPVRPAATPGTSVCDTGPWLTPGKAQPKVPKHGNPVQEGRIRLNGNGAGGAGVQSHMLLSNWADTAAEGSQVNTMSTFLTYLGIPGGGEEQFRCF